MWFIGLLCGAVHPLGFVLAIIVTSLYVAFIAMLGTYLSFRSKSSARAISATIAILVLINGGYLFCCVPMVISSGPSEGIEVVLAGITPLIVTVAPFSFDELNDVLWKGYRETPALIATGAVSLAFYGLTAVGLYQGCLSRFEIDDDRPRGEFLRSPGHVSREGIMFTDEAKTTDEGIHFINVLDDEHPPLHGDKDAEPGKDPGPPTAGA